MTSVYCGNVSVFMNKSKLLSICLIFIIFPFVVLFQNVFFNELSKNPSKEKWDPDNLAARFRLLILEIRHKFAMGEVSEYMLPNSPNLMAGYKQNNGYLVPKLGGVVRRMEMTMKDPVKVLSTLIDKWHSVGKLNH